MWAYGPLLIPLQTSLSTKLSKLCTRMQILRHTEKLYIQEDQYISVSQGNERCILSVWGRTQSC